MNTQQHKIRIGILFGGPSKEREISFAGGRTVCDNLDKSLCEPIPIFVTARRQLVRLDWPYLYKGSIRDFYPPPELRRDQSLFQSYEEHFDPEDTELHRRMQDSIGQTVEWNKLHEEIDFAFLCLHGEWGEDGHVQAILETENIPYSGSGVRASSIGIDKVFQKQWMKLTGQPTPRSMVLDRQALDEMDWDSAWAEVKSIVGMPVVIRPSRQGSSLGVSILEEDATIGDFQEAVFRGFFQVTFDPIRWASLSTPQRDKYVQDLIDIRTGIGLPVEIEGDLMRDPLTLRARLDQQSQAVTICHHHDEDQLLIEEFIDGVEFSAVVLRLLDGRIVCLPPTEIVKNAEVFDYRSKYLPGLSRKRTPAALPEVVVDKISTAAVDLFESMGFEVYARIDGFYRDSDDQVFLNDPNTTSGMLPSSFFFHQAAEIGLNPSQFLSFLITSSLQQRRRDFPSSVRIRNVEESWQGALSRKSLEDQKKIRVAVVFGGFSAERHVSVESGRNIYEKLASSSQYSPVPIFLTGSLDNQRLYRLPIRLMLKDNADDIAASLDQKDVHPIVLKSRAATDDVRQFFGGAGQQYFAEEIQYADLTEDFDFVFIALHGRPGEDGDIQKRLEEIGMPYNGSGIRSSQITIDKYETLQLLSSHGFAVAEQLQIHKSDYLADKQAVLSQIESTFSYPFIGKPVDEGCSAAVIRIASKSDLEAFLELLFRESEGHPASSQEVLGILPKEEVPRVRRLLFEEWVQANGAQEFKEITVGVMLRQGGRPEDLEVFEPSETLTAGDILTLEEKFLAGEGQNITPARLGSTAHEYAQISHSIKEQIAKAARILGIEGYARIDAFARVYSASKVEVVVIEANSLPGMTPATCIFHQAALHGLKPYQFIDEIIQSGLKTQRHSSISVNPL